LKLDDDENKDSSHENKPEASSKPIHQPESTSQSDTRPAQVINFLKRKYSILKIFR
jgi:hypothetical protein